MSALIYGKDEHGHSGEYRYERLNVTHRYGYLIDGETPVMLGHRSDGLDARREAERSAKAIREKLRELGVNKVKVSWWIQQRRTTKEVEHREPEIQELQ